MEITKKYAIVVDYYCWDEEKECEYTKPLYLGIMDITNRIYVFDEEFSPRTLRWDDKQKAIDYFIDHKFNEDACSYENARIVNVYTC